MRNRKKVIAYLTVLSMMLSTCKYNLKDLFKENELLQELPQDDFTTSHQESVPSTIETKETYVVETTMPIIEEPKVTYTVVCATTNVNIRSSNTTKSLKIGELKENETAIKILSCDNNWDLVKYNNQIGYIHRDYLEYTDEVYKDDYKHTFYNDIALTKTALNFRYEPTTEAQIITTFEENTELQVIAKVDNGWLLVKHNGVIGYVHGDYVISLLERINDEYENLNMTNLDVKKIVYATTGLNIRNGDSTDYEIISGLEEKESVRVLEEYKDWYLILTNDYNFGFINKNYTEKLDDIFVVVDIGEQKLYLYNNDELCYMTPVTTGKDTTPSDKGLFKIYYKERKTYLMNNSFVEYWMPYNGGEGLHDASWRSEFGKEDYKYNGSHGCINIPPEITDEIYETVSVGTKVLVQR